MYNIFIKYNTSPDCWFLLLVWDSVSGKSKGNSTLGLTGRSNGKLVGVFAFLRSLFLLLSFHLLLWLLLSGVKSGRLSKSTAISLGDASLPK